MSNRSKWTLQHEIKKRKTDEIRRSVESRHVIHPSTQRGLPANPPSLQAQSITATARKAPSVPAETSTHATQNAGHWTKHQRMVAIAAAFTIVSCLFISLLVLRDPVSPPALSALPTTTANKAVSYLKDVGLPVTNVQPLSVPNENWNANEEIQFNLAHTANSGVFVVLSYASPAEAGVDGLRATYHHKFKQWNLVQISNLLLLSSPGIASSLSDSVASHLIHYLITPYRSFMPTAVTKE